MRLTPGADRPLRESSGVKKEDVPIHLAFRADSAG